MARLTTGSVARDLATLFGSGTLANLTDGELLEQFVTHGNESCFRELVSRHGPLLLAICRRSLHDPRDVEDAFQAIFLTLVRKARLLRDREALSSWLYGVALRTVRRVRNNAEKQRLRERPMDCEPAVSGNIGHSVQREEIRAIIDQEIARLPDSQQLAVMLCLLEGHTHESAATALGWPVGTLKSRIASARQTLIRRLTRRGVAPQGMALLFRPGAGRIESLGPVSTRLVEMVAKSAVQAVTGASGLKLVGSAALGNLVREVARTMVVARTQATAVVLLTLTGAAVIAPGILSARPSSQPPDSKAPPVVAAQSVSSRKFDIYGDPLPPGAAMRFGTTRFRNEHSLNFMAYSPDGRIFVTDDQNRFFQVWDSNTGKKLRRIDSGIEHIRHFSFSPDGKTIAAVATPEYDGTGKGDRHRLTVIDVATGKCVHRKQLREAMRFRRIFFGPEGKSLITINESGGFHVWDRALTKILYREESEDNADVAVGSVTNANELLMAISRPNQIRLFDTARLKDVRSIAIDADHHVKHVIFSPDGQKLAGNVGRRFENNSELWLWNVSDGKLLKRFSSDRDRRWIGIVFSPDGNSLAAINDQDQVISFDVATGKQFDAFPGARASSNPLVFSPDGGTLATMDCDQALHFWDRATGRDRLATPDSHRDTVGILAFADAGKTLVSSSRDGSIRFWDISSGRLSKTRLAEGFITALATRTDGVMVAAGLDTDRKIAKVWNLQTGATIESLSIAQLEPGSWFSDVSISCDGSKLWAVSDETNFWCWEVGTGNNRVIGAGTAGGEKVPGWGNIQEFVSSPDGESVAVTSNESLIKIIDVRTGSTRFEASTSSYEPTLEERVGNSARFSFAPNGKSLAFVRRYWKGIKRADGELHVQFPCECTIVWVDSQSGQIRRELNVPDAEVGRLAFSPDGQFIAASASSNDRHFVRIFRIRDKKEMQKIETGAAQISSLAFTPNGAQIAAGLSDTSIVLWNVVKPD